MYVPGNNNSSSRYVNGGRKEERRKKAKTYNITQSQLKIINTSIDSYLLSTCDFGLLH
jgi:hypothetical protein